MPVALLTPISCPILSPGQVMQAPAWMTSPNTPVLEQELCIALPTRDALLEAVYRTEVEKLAAAERKLAQYSSDHGGCRTLATAPASNRKNDFSCVPATARCSSTSRWRQARKLTMSVAENTDKKLFPENHWTSKSHLDSASPPRYMC